MAQFLAEELRPHMPSSMAKKRLHYRSPQPLLTACEDPPVQAACPPSGYLLPNCLQVGLALQQLLSQAQGLPSALLLCPLAHRQAALQLQQLSAQPSILAVQHLHLGESGHRQD